MADVILVRCVAVLGCAFRRADTSDERVEPCVSFMVCAGVVDLLSVGATLLFDRKTCNAGFGGYCGYSVLPDSFSWTLPL